MKDKYYIFREPKSLKDLENLLRLRYRVFSDTNLRCFVEQNLDEIDLDPFDLNAKHFGLFKMDCEPVGYCRVVETHSDFNNDLLITIAKKYNQTHKIMEEPADPLPTMTYFEPNDATKVWLNNALKNNTKLVEPGRLSVQKGERLIGHTRQMTAAACSIYYIIRKTQAILSCNVSYGEFYQKYGFIKICNYFTSDKFGHLDTVLLFGSATYLSDDLKRELKNLAEEYKQTGQLYFSECCKSKV